MKTTRRGQKFDEIAAFADIGDFIEQPVKTYSSGMMMRLAFAVQTAVDPEVLIVDEALSVGDVFFQAKCMARMRQLLSEGVTLLFVSHDTGTVRQLCSRAVLLNRGEVLAVGAAQEVGDRYLQIELDERNAAASQRRPTEAACDAGSLPQASDQETRSQPWVSSGGTAQAQSASGGSREPSPSCLLSTNSWLEQVYSQRRRASIVPAVGRRASRTSRC